MLLIEKGQTTEFIVTLTEKVTLNLPKFLFRIVNDLTKNEVSFILPDISLYIDRYNQFEFTEGITATLESGFNHYYIYEQDNTENLDYKNATSLLEVGKLKVVDNATNDTIIFNEEEQYKSI